MNHRSIAFTATVTLALLPILTRGESFPVPQIPYAPLHYVCYRAAESLAIDGVLDEISWQKAASTELFVDIEGDLKPKPRFDTRAKMLWDDTYLYISAKMEEPDVWATLTERDAVIYHDNDFEVFIDPDGDTHEYYELELNALNTIWDLFLLKPYRDGGPAVNAWDIQGLKTAVHIDGTLNTPGDTDSGWSVEIALPWKVLAECAHRPSPPREGDQWRLNFSRVEWRTEVKDGQYVKLLDSLTGKPLPEDNWVWSPQGLIAMHYPEMWGIVQFTYTDVRGEEVPFAPDPAEPKRRTLRRIYNVPFAPDPAEPARWMARRIYYAEMEHRTQHGTYTSDLKELKIDSTASGVHWPPYIDVSNGRFVATAWEDDGRVYFDITEDGRLTRGEVRGCRMNWGPW